MRGTGAKFRGAVGEGRVMYVPRQLNKENEARCGLIDSSRILLQMCAGMSPSSEVKQRAVQYHNVYSQANGSSHTATEYILVRLVVQVIDSVWIHLKSASPSLSQLTTNNCSALVGRISVFSVHFVLGEQKMKFMRSMHGKRLLVLKHY